MGSPERMHVKQDDRQDLGSLARRFAWMTLAIFAALTIGLWVAHVAWPTVVGPSLDYDYVVGVSLLCAVTFGGLFAAGLALRSARPREPAPTKVP